MGPPGLGSQTLKLLLIKEMLTFPTRFTEAFHGLKAIPDTLWETDNQEERMPRLKCVGVGRGGRGGWLLLNGLSILHRVFEGNPYGSCQYSPCFNESHVEIPFYSHLREYSLANKPLGSWRERAGPATLACRKKHCFLSQTILSMAPFEVRMDSIAVLIIIRSRHRTCQKQYFKGTRGGIV